MSVRCALCESEEVEAWLHKGSYELDRCRSCGVGFWTPPPGFDPTQIYDAEYFRGSAIGRGYDDYEGLEASLRRTFRGRLKRIVATERGAPMLDVGAAFGFSTDEASRLGWRATSVEIGGAAARRAAQSVPGRVVRGDGTRLPFASESFELVTLWDVIEHLADPHAAIAEIARVLRQRGRLVLTTGDRDSWAARFSGTRWHLLNLPEHLFFYNRASLRRLLEPHGFRIERIDAEASFYTVGYLIERLRKSLLGRESDEQRSFPGAEFVVPVNLYDIVTLSAVRVGAS